jgi:hypothetical protein
MRRFVHAIAEVNLDAVCRPVGNLNSVKITIIFALNHHPPEGI